MTQKKTQRPNVEESETIEFKSSLSEIKEIIETLSAFSNSNGGRVLVGIDDKGRIKGVDIGRSTIENLANEIKRHTDPPLFPSITVEEHDKKNIISIEVKEGPIKPVFAYDRAFKRVGKTNQRLNDLSKPTASRELSALVKKGIVERQGRTGRGTAYTLKGSNGSETAHKRLKEDN